MPASPNNPSDLHHYLRPDMDTFVVDYPEKLLHDRGSTFVWGHFVTPELARELQAAHQELEEAKRRAGLGEHDEGRDLPAWEDYFDVRHKIGDERRLSYGRFNNNIDNDDGLDISTPWLFENLEVDEHERIVPGQIITPEQLAISGAVFMFGPMRDGVAARAMIGDEHLTPRQQS